MLEKVQIVVFKIVKSELMVLLLQTNKARGSFWQNITGGVESFDHTIQEAALREIEEEIGVRLANKQLNSLDYMFEYDNKKRCHHYKEHCFYTIIDDSEKIKISELEHQSFKWMRANDISNASYRFITNYEAFKRAFQVVGSN